MSKTRPYRESLIESLADPVEAKHYLKAVLHDYPEGFLKALRNVAQANQMAKVAEAAGVKRESLYRALSDNGNPTLDTLVGVLAAVGLCLDVRSLHEAEDEPPATYAKAESKIQEIEHGIFVGQFNASDVQRGNHIQEETIGPLHCTVAPVNQNTPTLPMLLWTPQGDKNGFTDR